MKYRNYVQLMYKSVLKISVLPHWTVRKTETDRYLSALLLGLEQPVGEKIN